MTDTTLNLIIVLTPLIAILATISYILISQIVEVLQDHFKTLSFNNHYQTQQRMILCKQAHNAGILAGKYYSKEYKQAYSIVMGY